jgi:cobalt-precorrin-5B (C1)-methyltransferase
MRSNRKKVSSGQRAGQRLRTGFSTGTAATAAARAALRRLLTGEPPGVVAVRLPMDYYVCIPIFESSREAYTASATVIKDGGDDPDVTNGAEIRATVRLSVAARSGSAGGSPGNEETCGRNDLPAGIYLSAGRGVGHATKPGLPVGVGEPAINPVPRFMLARNLTEELLLRSNRASTGLLAGNPDEGTAGPFIYLPFQDAGDLPKDLALHVEIEVPKGIELAQRTLNPRLGIQGGISILGTTGLVKPFSHEAYEDTIRAALSVAASNGCCGIVLSTGGKSENLARRMLGDLPGESFVQIADFFAFAVGETARMGFGAIVHSVFFGKAVKMAQGHAYTHAHRVPLNLKQVARLAEQHGYTKDFCRELEEANTARHALEILLCHGAGEVIREVAREALRQSALLAGDKIDVRLLLFHHDGTLLADVKK